MVTAIASTTPHHSDHQRGTTASARKCARSQRACDPQAAATTHAAAVGPAFDAMTASMTYSASPASCNASIRKSRSWLRMPPKSR